MKVFIQEQSGNYNLDREYVLSKYLSEIVAALQIDGGYYTQDREGKDVFIPLHRICFIREV